MQVVVGAILMAIVHTFANIGLPVIMLPILAPNNARLAYGYLGAALTATVVLVVGAILLLLLIPLSDAYVSANAAVTPQLVIIAVIVRKGGWFCYQIGMAIWGLGGLMFCSVLYQSRLIPRPIAVWGLMGYVIFVSGTLLELFGYGVGLLLSIPGGLFEIALRILLIVRGFSPSPLIRSQAPALQVMRSTLARTWPTVSS